MRSIAARCTVVCAGLALLLGAQSCTLTLFDGHHGRRTGPPDHAPAHGHRARHAYVYYPSSYVYFSATLRAYFYLAGGTWRRSATLPSSITINPREAVSIELDTDRPYQYFNAHKKRYPPGQIKKRYRRARSGKEQPPGKHKQPPGQTKKEDKGKNKKK